jgi:hypothetical protein
MAVNYRTSLKTTRMTSVRDDIDSGAGAGTLEVCTAAFASVLITFTLSDPSGTIASDVLTLSGMPKAANAAATGTAAVARIKESGGAVVVNNLTVGTSGTDIIISSTSITSGNPYNLNSGTITHAA